MFEIVNIADHSYTDRPYWGEDQQKAINDVFSGKPSLMNDKTCNEVMTTYLNKIEEEKQALRHDAYMS